MRAYHPPFVIRRRCYSCCCSVALAVQVNLWTTPPGEGFCLVVQGAGNRTIGTGGSALGYGGIAQVS